MERRREGRRKRAVSLIDTMLQNVAINREATPIHMYTT